MLKVTFSVESDISEGENWHLVSEVTFSGEKVTFSGEKVTFSGESDI